jgi:hypothetical protein
MKSHEPHAHAQKASIRSMECLTIPAALIASHQFDSQNLPTAVGTQKTSALKARFIQRRTFDLLHCHASTDWGA